MLRWFLRLLENTKSTNNLITSDSSGLMQNGSGSMFFIMENNEKYYMLNYDNLIADFRFLYTDRRATFTHYMEHLCGIGSSCGGPVSGKVYPLKRIVRYTKFGTKAFFHINDDVINYLEGKDDTILSDKYTTPVPTVDKPPNQTKEPDMDLLDDVPSPEQTIVEPKKQEVLTDEFLSFYKKIRKIHEFSDKLYDKNDQPFKHLLDAQKYYYQIKEKTFTIKNVFKEKFIGEFPTLTDTDLIRIFNDFSTYMESQDKEIKSLAAFFYNPVQRYSYFLTNMKMYLEGKKTACDKNNEWMEMPNEDAEEIYTEICRGSWDVNIDKKINVHNAFVRLYNHMNENEYRYEVLSQKFRFLERMFWPVFVEWIQKWKSVSPRHFELDSPACQSFHDALAREGFDIAYDPEQFAAKVQDYNRMIEADKKWMKQKEEQEKIYNTYQLQGDADVIVAEKEPLRGEEVKEERKKKLLFELSIASDDILWIDDHRDDDLDDLEKMYAKYNEKNSFALDRY